MLPYNLGEYEPKQKYIDFESVSEIFLKEDGKMVAKRHFQRLYHMMDFK